MDVIQRVLKLVSIGCVIRRARHGGNPCHGSVRFLGNEPCRPWAVWLHVAFKGSYLVDPASSHMLVSKIKPCMSKYKHLYTVKLRTAHYIS